MESFISGDMISRLCVTLVPLAIEISPCLLVGIHFLYRFSRFDIILKHVLVDRKVTKFQSHTP